jgi:mannosidase alpha-like ER degradation enhancer 2
LLFDAFNRYTVTLIDALDSLLVLGDVASFQWAVGWLIEHLNLDMDRNVSVFETNIRLMGALLSAHLFAAPPSLYALSGPSPCVLRWFGK